MPQPPEPHDSSSLFSVLSRRLTGILLMLAVIFFDSRLTIAATHLGPQADTQAPSAASTKTYAVFIATFDTRTGQAQGGVAGTAFFTSSTRALTAFHVIRPEVFSAQSDSKTTQVWLIHEGQQAIELSINYLRFQPSSDLTVIDLPPNLAVSQDYVFELQTTLSSTLSSTASLKDPKSRPRSEGLDEVFTTEGFRANTTGPTFRSTGRRLEILSVPSLERLSAQGFLEVFRDVTLTSDDVNLKKSPCLRLSYLPVVGLSGGPVIAAKSGLVVGMNSFADPDRRQKTWAVDLRPNSNTELNLTN